VSQLFHLESAIKGRRHWYQGVHIIISSVQGMSEHLVGASINHVRLTGTFSSLTLSQWPTLGRIYHQYISWSTPTFLPSWRLRSVHLNNCLGASRTSLKHSTGIDLHIRWVWFLMYSYKVSSTTCTTALARVIEDHQLIGVTIRGTAANGTSLGLKFTPHSCLVLSPEHQFPFFRFNMFKRSFLILRKSRWR